MTAIAAQVPIRLGTAIMVPYFHNLSTWPTLRRAIRILSR
jgi:hypothetical protein